MMALLVVTTVEPTTLSHQKVAYAFLQKLEKPTPRKTQVLATAGHILPAMDNPSDMLVVGLSVAGVGR